jgi:hypothetical protein
MLAITSYKRDFVDACRDRADRQLQAYDALVRSAKAPEIAAFAPEFFNNLVLALDHYFMHRQRSLEGKDGNPLNEVRMLAVSLLDHGGVMTKDNTIKYDAAKAVTGIRIGEKIVIDRDTFARLADAFFDEIEKKYP